MGHSLTRLTAAGTAAGIMAILLASCGASTPTTVKATHVNQAGLKAAETATLAAEKLPTTRVPTSPVDMAKLKGKTVWIITSTLAVPFVASIANGAQTAAKLLGWHTILLNGNGLPADWSADVDEAVAEHVNAIISVAASPAEMVPAMAKAKAANIPVVDVLTAGIHQPLISGTYAHDSISFYASGELQADYVIWKSGGRADALILGDTEFPGEVRRVDGMIHAFKTLCPTCHYEVHNTLVADIATSLPAETQTLLRKDPSITWVLPTYDAQAEYVVPAIVQAGLQNRVKVVSSDAVPLNLNWVKERHVEIADVGEPDVWAGWAAVDEIGRAMLGLPAVQEYLPLRMFVPSNLKGVNTSNENALWGGDYVHAFERLWGVAS